MLNICVKNYFSRQIQRKIRIIINVPTFSNKFTSIIVCIYNKPYLHYMRSIVECGQIAVAVLPYDQLYILKLYIRVYNQFVVNVKFFFIHLYFDTFILRYTIMIYYV